ncbi:putative ABC transport system ATP-binding protein [Methanomicrobium sp. W14]|uniref:ABC transporter ATP-binding protein n=1 Tax=Methanomicrobium sp. W14 TaxID=2817839 RepID=UPI001AE5E0A2|nr:ABC transporter ATP-binding protein [Methanomicrobium sp. W14]MBP2133310.1 putative ABC transport system ATP-binding protein [Methanomicrobium sp. W14]
MIRADNLFKTYQMGGVSIKALNGVSVEIRKGEFIGLMGPSGSGKSTLLHMLGLLDRPGSGKIIIGGIDTSVLSDGDRTLFRLNRLGFVFQDYALVPELTVLENVFLPSMVRGEDPEIYVKKSNEILELIGLSGRSDNLKKELSGGQQQRVSIARGLVNKPDILFADEPCANLDSNNSRVVLDLCRKINRETGQTIVMVSHEGWHKEYFDRVINLKDGKIESVEDLVGNP